MTIDQLLAEYVLLHQGIIRVFYLSLDLWEQYQEEIDHDPAYDHTHWRDISFVYTDQQGEERTVPVLLDENQALGSVEVAMVPDVMPVGL